MHEAPARFVCSRCGSFGCEACAFSTLPGREVCQGCAELGLGEPIPWERRKEQGNWSAFWRTAKLATREPTKFFRTPTTQESVFGAVAHGALTYTLGSMLGYVLSALLVMIGGGAIAMTLPNSDSNMVGELVGFYGCMLLGMSPLALVFGPANAIFGLVFAAACSHATLALFGKANAGFESTLRALSYTNAPRIVFFVPVLGLFAWFWMLGMEVIALRETHRTSTDVAALAALGYRVIAIGGLVGFYVLMIVAVALSAPPA
ncbi:MAG: YIP1 family protein [Sandaracinaceae bacterium]